MILPQLEAKLGDGREVGSGELNFCCPFCVSRKGTPDTKYHFYVNPNRLIDDVKGWFYCHRCHAAGPISKLLSDSDILQREASQWDEYVAKLKSLGARSEASSSEKVVSLPEDYHHTVKCTDAYRYLKSRGITDDIIEDYRIGFGTQSLREIPRAERRRYAGSGRIIFPDFRLDGSLVYWVARTYRGHKVKYKNPPDSDARDKLYNLARASVYDTVIITEGVISAIAAGRNAIATYGKDVTSTQVSMLVASRFDRYIVALDGDASKYGFIAKPGKRGRSLPPAIKLAKQLRSHDCNVWMVRLPYWDDPDSVGDFPRYLRNAVEFDLAVEADMLLTAFS